MKKLKLSFDQLQDTQVLSREQLRTILGGDTVPGSSGGGGGGGVNPNCLHRNDLNCTIPTQVPGAGTNGPVCCTGLTCYPLASGEGTVCG